MVFTCTCSLVMLLLGVKSATGLMEWMTVEASLEAFILANHQTVYSQSMQSLQKNFLLKLFPGCDYILSNCFLLHLLFFFYLSFLYFSRSSVYFQVGILKQYFIGWDLQR